MDSNLDNNVNQEINNQLNNQVSPQVDAMPTNINVEQNGQSISQVETATAALNNQTDSLQAPVQNVGEINSQEMPTVPETVETPNISTPVNDLTKINSIPTVEQGEQDFISNVQAMSTEKVEEKKEINLNFRLMIILFIAVLVAIFFIFPLLK